MLYRRSARLLDERLNARGRFTKVELKTQAEIQLVPCIRIDQSGVDPQRNGPMESRLFLQKAVSCGVGWLNLAFLVNLKIHKKLKDITEGRLCKTRFTFPVHTRNAGILAVNEFVSLYFLLPVAWTILDRETLVIAMFTWLQNVYVTFKCMFWVCVFLLFFVVVVFSLCFSGISM